MKLSANIMRLHDIFGIKGTIDIFSDAGFEGMDFNNDILEYSGDLYDKNFYTDIKKYANDKNVEICQAHAPFASSFLEDNKTKERFLDITKSMRNASYLGAKMIVVHSCVHKPYKGNEEELFEYNLKFFKSLIPYAEEFDIKVAIENVCTQARDSITSTADRLITLLDALNNDAFTICFDVGHTFLCGLDIGEEIEKLGNRIGCTHIHDNNGVADLHTLPFYGQIEWESVMKAFAKSGYTGNLSFEAARFMKEVPTALRLDAMKYKSKVGHYLIDRFNFYKNEK
ncbi:MAG: sugar phosphate isomerase/epimerase [Clostridiales bacterium]|nr:sugar phosphate isomerase/epimerase [Clostridiales bacterium]